MKDSKQASTPHHTQVSNNKHRPENKNSLDSREGEEQLIQGGKTTHNAREHKSDSKQHNK